MNELRRLLCAPKRIILLLMIALCNLALFAGYCGTVGQTDAVYREMMQSFGIDPDEYDAQQAEAAEKEKQRYREEVYPQYLEYVQSQSGTQSVLGKLAAKQDDYVQRNLEKTAAKYQKLTGLTLTEGCDEAVNAVKDYDITDYLLLIAPLLLVLSLAADTETAVGALTRTTKRGRVPLCAQQILAVVLMSALSALLLYGGNIAYAAYYFGNPGLLRAVQSVPAFQLCSVRLSVAGYFISAYWLKVLAAAVISLFVWLMQSRMKPLLGWLVSAAGVGGCFLLHRFVLPTAKLSHVKFLNVFAALESDVFFTQYSNLNWFGFPSDFCADMLIAVGMLGAVLAVLCLVLIGYCRPGKLGSGIERFGDQISRRLSGLTRCRSLFGFEGWKLLIAERGILVLAVTALLGVTVWQQTHLYTWMSPDTKKIYDRYQGEVTDEKLDRVADQLTRIEESIERQEARIAELEAAEEPKQRAIEEAYGKLSEFKAELTLYTALQTTLLELREFTDRTGLPAWFIPQTAYQMMFYENASIRRCCMVLLLFLIFLFRSIHAYDNRYETGMLLRATKRGRGRRLTASWMWVMLLTGIAVLSLHGIYLIRVQQDVGFTMLGAPAQSMKLLQWIPVSVSMRTVIIAQFVLRYAAALLIAGCVVQISRFSRTPETALLTALAVFLLPSALCESGIGTGIALMRALDFVHWLGCAVSSSS